MKTGFKQTIICPFPAVATGVDATFAVARVPFDGVVTAVSIIANAEIEGANTNTRAHRLKNIQRAGIGTIIIAEKQYNGGIDLPLLDERELTNSAMAANLQVVKDDVLALFSEAVGTGLADGGGLVVIVLSRTS